MTGDTMLQTTPKKSLVEEYDSLLRDNKVNHERLKDKLLKAIIMRLDDESRIVSPENLALMSTYIQLGQIPRYE